MPPKHTGARIMPARIGDPTPKSRHPGRIPKTIGKVIAFTGWVGTPIMAIAGYVTDEASVLEAVLGTLEFWLCVVPAVAGGPWLIGVLMELQADARVVLDGPRLTVVGTVRATTFTFDLTRARCRVELRGGVDDSVRKRPTGAARPAGESIFDTVRRFPLPYRPVLVFRRESGEEIISVDLCNPATRAMRDPAEILAIAEQLSLAFDPKTQRAAGQLRTVARWERLPRITEARADAIPETPIDRAPDAPLIPTPVAAGEPAAEITIVPDEV